MTVAETEAERMTRIHSGPIPNTYVISVELPPGTADEKTRQALFTAIFRVSKAVVPEAYVTGHTIMERKGKHDSGNGNGIRGVSNRD